MGRARVWVSEMAKEHLPFFRGMLSACQATLLSSHPWVCAEPAARRDDTVATGREPAPCFDVPPSSPKGPRSGYLMSRLLGSRDTPPFPSEATTSPRLFGCFGRPRLPVYQSGGGGVENCVWTLHIRGGQAAQGESRKPTKEDGESLTGLSVPDGLAAVGF